MALTPASLRLDLKCGKGSISEGEKCSKGPAQRVQLGKKFIQVPKDYPGRKQPYGAGFRSKAENALIGSGQVVMGASALANVAELAFPPPFLTTRRPYSAIATSVGGALTSAGLASKAHRLSKEPTTEGKQISKTQQKHIKRLRSQAIHGLTIGALGAAVAYGIHRTGQRARNVNPFISPLGARQASGGSKSDPRRQQLENLYASSASQSLRNKQNTFGSLAMLKGRLTQSAKRRELERLVKRRDSVWAQGFEP